MCDSRSALGLFIISCSDAIHNVFVQYSHENREQGKLAELRVYFWERIKYSAKL